VADARRWFRVELSPSGKLVDCRPVDHADRDAGFVFYTRANGHEDAIKTVCRLHQRMMQAKRRSALIAAGRCPWCGQAADRGPGLRCVACKKKNRDEGQRRRDRDAAVSVGREPPPKVPRANSSGVRHQILLEVNTAWQAASSNGAFTKWLNDEIRRANERLGTTPLRALQKKTGT
jgi:hypothetical protein